MIKQGLPLSQAELQRLANEIITDEVIQDIRQFTADEHLRLSYGGLTSAVMGYERLAASAASADELKSGQYGVLLMRAYTVLAQRACHPSADLPPLILSEEPSPRASDVLQRVMGKEVALKPGHLVDSDYVQAALDTGGIVGRLEVRTDQATRIVWVDFRQGERLVISLPLLTLLAATVADKTKADQ